MKVLSVIKYLFSAIGVALLAGAFYLYQSKQEFLEKADRVQGTVVELIAKRSDKSTTYAPVVVFKTKKGQEIKYFSSVSSNPPSYSEGENVEMLYDPQNPHDASINGFFSLWLGPLILSILGAIFFIIGSVIIVIAWLQDKKTENLRETGKPISTKFTQVQLNTGYAVNGRNPFQICSQWQDPHTKDLYVFKSDNIWFDPTDFLNIEEIRVLIDPQDPKKYIMDTSFLPVLKN